MKKGDNNNNNSTLPCAAFLLDGDLAWWLIKVIMDRVDVLAWNTVHCSCNMHTHNNNI